MEPEARALAGQRLLLKRRVTRAAPKQKLAPSDISPCGPLKEAREIKNKNSCVPNNNKRGSEKLKACRRAVG